MSVKGKRAKRKISSALFFIFLMFLLIIFGWLMKNDFKIASRDLVVPIGEKNIEKQIEARLKNFAFGEDLILSKIQLVDEERALIVIFSDRLTCFFSLEDEIEPQLASLQFILWRAKIESKSLKTVDLRFDKPVIRY